MFYCKFLAESKHERILKIGKHLAKLLTENIVGFFDSQCTMMQLAVVLPTVVLSQTGPIHSKNSLLVQLVQFYLDGSISILNVIIIIIRSKPLAGAKPSPFADIKARNSCGALSGTRRVDGNRQTRQTD